MAQIHAVKSARAYQFETILGKFVAIEAMGEVPTSGWTAPRLAPRYYISPPDGGIWEFDFLVDPPSGIVLQVIMSIASHVVIELPDWVKGIRVNAETNSVTANLESSTSGPVRAPQPSPAMSILGESVIVQRGIATFDDSQQPTGTIHWDGIVPHVEMKKLRHELVLTVTGPDADKIHECINKAIAAGLLAAIVAAAATGGAALPAAISAFLGALTSCLGDSFNARIDDNSHWIYWDT